MGFFCSMPGGERGVADVGVRFYLFTIESLAGGPFRACLYFWKREVCAWKCLDLFVQKGLSHIIMVAYFVYDVMCFKMRERSV